MTLHFRPLPEPCEPKAIRQAREELRLSWSHPDTDEIGRVLDALSHALLRVEEQAQTVADAAVREALTGPHGGLVACLKDAISEVCHALECWRENPWNDPQHLAECEAVDLRNLMEREAR